MRNDFQQMRQASSCTVAGARSRSDALLYVKLVLTAVFWGGTFIAGRIVSREAGPFSAAFLRFVVASVFLSLFVFKAHGRIVVPDARHIFMLCLLGLTGVFGYNFFFFSGLQTVSASRASLIVAANPAFIALLSALIFKEKLGFVKSMGIAISVCGAATVAIRGDLHSVFHGGIGVGELFIFGCVASWVSYSLLGKTVMKNLTPLLAVTYACALGTLCLFIPAMSEGVARSALHFSVSVWEGIFFLGFFGSALAFVWYYEGISALGPSRAGIFINLVPISSVLLAHLILSEPLDASVMVGTILVTIGVFLANRF